MRIVVLISAGRHPVSGHPAPVPVEMAAIRLAADLGTPPEGVHVGGDPALVVDALGFGLRHLVVVQAGDTACGDPLAPLRDHLLADPPDLVLAGRRGRGGSDSGMLPYRLAHALAWPLIADIVALSRNAGELQVAQALPRGARRIVQIGTPCVATVHPAAPPARPFRHAGLRGAVVRRSSPPMPQYPDVEIRPYRARPQSIDRSQGGGLVLRAVTPEQAAADILAELRRLNVLRGDIT